LQQQGYSRYSYDTEDEMTVIDILLMYNHYDNEVVIETYENKDESHVFYVHNATIHDNAPIEERSQWLASVVTMVWLRQKGNK